MKLILLSAYLALSLVRSIEVEEHSQQSTDIVIDQSTNNDEGEMVVSVTETLNGEAKLHEDREMGESTFDNVKKPKRNLFLGIYKNYKSTYLGNRTSSQYRQLLKERHSSMETATTIAPDETSSSEGNPKARKKKNRHRTNKKKRAGAVLNEDPLIYSPEEQYRYKLGPGVNMSLDMRNDIISVNLDEDCLKDILLGRWNDPEVEGRGKKYEMISKIIPLFILPFLIQSAILPFLVTKLKLLLVKSILVGKLAIFLLVISALRNNSKSAPTYEVAPSYWAGEPSRRSEAPSFSGYRVEGRPTAWVN